APSLVTSIGVPGGSGDPPAEQGECRNPTTVPLVLVTATLRASVGNVGRRSAGADDRLAGGSDDRRESHRSFLFVKLDGVAAPHAEVAAVERWWAGRTRPPSSWGVWPGRASHGA